MDVRGADIARACKGTRPSTKEQVRASGAVAAVATSKSSPDPARHRLLVRHRWAEPTVGHTWLTPLTRPTSDGRPAGSGRAKAAKRVQQARIGATWLADPFGQIESRDHIDEAWLPLPCARPGRSTKGNSVRVALR